MNRKQVVAALRATPASDDFVWNGQDEDERPATAEEIAAALTTLRRRGRPAGSGMKEQVAIRFEREVLATLRASGPGWQTRVSDAVSQLVKKGRL